MAPCWGRGPENRTKPLSVARPNLSAESCTAGGSGMALAAFVRCVRTFGVSCDCLLVVVAISGFRANLNFDFK